MTDDESTIGTKIRKQVDALNDMIHEASKLGVSTKLFEEYKIRGYSNTRCSFLHCSITKEL